MKLRQQGFQKQTNQPGAREVGLAVITYHDTAQVGCSCGWGYIHTREKVREDAIDRHLDKHHQGRGIRL